MTSFTIILLVLYIAGMVMAWGMTDLVEEYRLEEYTPEDRIRLIIGSWYSCYILNKLLDKLS